MSRLLAHSFTPPILWYASTRRVGRRAATFLSCWSAGALTETELHYIQGQDLLGSGRKMGSQDNKEQWNETGT